MEFDLSDVRYVVDADSGRPQIVRVYRLIEDELRYGHESMPFTWLLHDPDLFADKNDAIAELKRRIGYRKQKLTRHLRYCDEVLQAIENNVLNID